MTMNITKDRRTGKEVTVTVILAAYMFIHMATGTMINKNSTGFLSADVHLYMYYINQLCMVAGFFAFPFIWNRQKSDEKRTIMLRITAALFFLLDFILIIFPSTFGFLVLSPAVNFLLGIVGGAFNFFLSTALLGTDILGKIIAFGAGVSFILQYIVQIRADSRLLLFFFILAGAVVIVVMSKKAWEWILLECLPGVSREKSEDMYYKKSFNTAFIMMFFAVLLLTYYDSRLIRMMVESDLKAISAYSYPRLFAILGYLIIGVVGDIKERKYVNITLVIIILWLLLMPVIFADNPSSNLNMSLFYVAVGATLGYSYLMFWSIAPYTAHHALVASMGRIIEGIAGVVFSFLPWGDMSAKQVMIVGIASASVMIVAMVYNGDLGGRSKEQIDAAGQNVQSDDEGVIIGGAEGKTESDIFVRLSERYNITDREMDVLKKLIFTEDSGQEIAESLFISRRVFQRHVASLYEKTGTKSRVGLYRVYHDEENNKA